MIAAMGIVMSRFSPWSRALSFGGIGILVLIEITTAQRSSLTSGQVIGAVIATAVVAGAWTLLVERYQRHHESPVGPALVVVIAAGSIAMVIFTPEGAAIIATILALSAAANRFDRKTGVAFAIVLISAYLAATYSRLGFQPVNLLANGLGLTFAFVASRSVAQLRQEQARTQRLLHELEASRAAQIQSAAMNERARLAREIHDVLAHTLAALAVQLEGARMMLEQRDSDPEALASVERAHRLAREGLDETRRAVSALRGDRVPGPAQLALLVDEFKRDSGTPAALRIEGDAREVGPEAQLALYRTAQEALTNVRKHARAHQVEVVLSYDTEGTELTVTDSGEAITAGVGSGFGLVGMRERAELLGGTLEAGEIEGGFRVRLWLPA